MNRTILISGNRKGIGRYLSEYYLNNGYNVIGCSRNKTNLSHKNYFHIIGDVSNELDVINIVKLGFKKFGSIDILINNAGQASLNHSILTPSKTVENIFGVNFNGTFYLSRECAKIMMKNKFGRIINFSTVAVPLNLEGEMIYASSKNAVEKMSKILSKELSSFNITVNVIGPTPIETDLMKVVPKDKVKEILEKQVIKRFGEFSEISNVTDFFINDKSSFITGQKIYLGGL